MTLPRRRFLASCAGALASGAGGALRPARAGAGAPSPQPPVPAAQAVSLVAAPLASDSSRLSYDATAAGPVIRARKGVPLAIRLTNRLAGPTTLDWHGLRGPASIGDVTALTRLVAPGETLTQTLVPPDSGLFWFHPASGPGLPDQTAAGLLGALIVEEAEPPVVDRDILLVLSDAGSATMVVNGAAAPQRETITSGGRLRLRLLNASTERLLVLAIEGTRPKIVAIDGQPSELFEPVRDEVPLGPGARFELMMDAPEAAGRTIRLLLRAAAAGAPDPSLLELTTTGPARQKLPSLAPLPRNPALPQAIPLERAVRADLVLEPIPAAKPGEAGWRIGSTATLALPATPLLTVPRGRPVTLGLDNRSPVPVPFRLHGQVMRLLHAKDDGWEPYWRDSVMVPPMAVSHVAFLAETPGRWLLDSASFAQASAGLRRWFAIR